MMNKIRFSIKNNILLKKLNSSDLFSKFVKVKNNLTSKRCINILLNSVSNYKFQSKEKFKKLKL